MTTTGTLENLLNEHDVARVTGLSVASLRRWRLLKSGSSDEERAMPVARRLFHWTTNNTKFGAQSEGPLAASRVFRRDTAEAARGEGEIEVDGRLYLGDTTG